MPINAPPEERILSMHTPQPNPADILLLGQGSGQGAGQMAGQASSLTVKEVHALGAELCSEVGFLRVSHHKPVK